MQSTERFGAGTDPDGDRVVNELTRADITAAVIFQATLPVPGRMLTADIDAQRAAEAGENLFQSMGCAGCHIPRLPLDKQGWIFTEPNPYNPAGNLRVGEAPTLSVDLTNDDLPGPRLKPDKDGIVWVEAFTDFKLHDICAAKDDPNGEPLDMQFKPGTAAFFAGNRKFITRKLWGAANEPPYYHHGQYTTMREAVLAHDGEALQARQAFQAATQNDQASVIEFLKTLQVLPEDATSPGAAPRRGKGRNRRNERTNPMNNRTIRIDHLLRVLLCLHLAALSGMAQDFSVFARDLQKPAKVIVTPQGNLLVSEGGLPEPNTGRVSFIDQGGNRRSLLEGLPNARAYTLNPYGPTGMALDGDTLYLLIGEGDVQAFPPPAVRLNPDGPSSPIFSTILKIQFSAEVDRLGGTFRLQSPGDWALLDGHVVRDWRTRLASGPTSSC
jgi:hypothetical protein